MVHFSISLMLTSNLGLTTPHCGSNGETFVSQEAYILKFTADHLIISDLS